MLLNPSMVLNYVGIAWRAGEPAAPLGHAPFIKAYGFRTLKGTSRPKGRCHLRTLLSESL